MLDVCPRPLSKKSTGYLACRLWPVPEQWEPGGDELPPTMKLKAQADRGKYAEEIEAFYSG